MKLNQTNNERKNYSYRFENYRKNLSEDYEDDFDFEESDFDDNTVKAGKTFFENGCDYQYVSRVGEDVYLDFDHWAIWKVINLDSDTDELEYVIVEEDTGFIDWGPVETREEAEEFLQSKIDDYENDDYFSSSEEFEIEEDSEE